MKIKLQAVSVCVNYADFFKHTAPENKGIFDKWIIVTDKADTEVEALCIEHGLTCVKTDAFYEHGIFNKYAGINEGLKLVDDDAWILFLDSDIVLQKETRRVLEHIPLSINKMYGIDRLNCVGYKKWKQYKAGSGVLTQNWLLSAAGLELGARLVHYYGHQGENGRFEGWRPLGFFQLVHRSQFVTYPQDTLGADHCDLIFAREWTRKDRVLIPELLGVHLESEGAGKAINWYGRKSKPFEDEHDYVCDVCEQVEDHTDKYYNDEISLGVIKASLLENSQIKPTEKLELIQTSAADDLIAVIKKICLGFKS